MIILKKFAYENKKNYKKYKKWCDEYFICLTGRKLEVLVEFFDYETKDWIKNFKFVRELGLAFIDISNKVINRKKKLKYTKKDKEKQLLKEEDMLSLIFCMIEYKIWFKFWRNTDSILMSLPPKAKWK